MANWPSGYRPEYSVQSPDSPQMPLSRAGKFGKFERTSLESTCKVPIANPRRAGGDFRCFS